jgi:hypothetical protein
MKRRWVVPAAGIALAAVLAYFLREEVNNRIVTPLVYLWWKIELYFRSVPEDNWLAIAAAALFLLAYLSLTSIHEPSPDSDSPVRQSVHGPVEDLMTWLVKAPRNSYYRWLVANQLARLARSFLIIREGRNIQSWDGSFDSPGWDPPEDVDAYLRSGLSRSFAGMQPSSAGRSRTKSFGLDPNRAIEYIESKMEERYDGN